MPGSLDDFDEQQEEEEEGEDLTEETKLPEDVTEEDNEDENEEKESEQDTNICERLIQWVDGFPLPNGLFSPNKLREVLEMEFRSTDIVLSTFPKCGTTWTQYVIWGIINNGAPPPDVNQMMMKLFPFLEFMGVEILDDLEDPRMIKLHLPYEMTPKSDEARYVHILRNPFDVCVSMHHHLSEIDAKTIGKELPFDEYFEAFMIGHVQFGDYFEFENGWFAHRDDPNVLFLTYENMKKNPEEAILRIADFLGQGELLREQEGVLDNILKHSSFDYLKSNCSFRMAKNIDAYERMGKDLQKCIIDKEVVKDDSLFRTINFFRKGQVGSSREKLSDDQWRRMEEAIQERVHEPELRELMMMDRPTPEPEKTKFCQIL